MIINFYNSYTILKNKKLLIKNSKITQNINNVLKNNIYYLLSEPWTGVYNNPNIKKDIKHFY